MLSIGRWRPTQLLLAWVAYWVALAAVTLGPAARAAWRVTRPGEGHGSVTANYADGVVDLKVIQDGATVWSGATDMLSAVLWIAVPPLVLWVTWIATRPSRVERADEVRERVER